MNKFPKLNLLNTKTVERYEVPMVNDDRPKGSDPGEIYLEIFKRRSYTRGNLGLMDILGVHPVWIIERDEKGEVRNEYMRFEHTVGAFCQIKISQIQSVITVTTENIAYNIDSPSKIVEHLNDYFEKYLSQVNS